MWMRVAVAFVAAPAIGALVASLVATTIWSFYYGTTIWSLYFVLLFATLVAAYVVAFVLGVPWFLVWPWCPKSVWGYALAGAIVAVVPALFLILFFYLSSVFFIFGILAGALTGLTFGVIVMPTSNNRWRGP
jgi:hypothetical protein